MAMIEGQGAGECSAIVVFGMEKWPKMGKHGQKVNSSSAHISVGKAISFVFWAGLQRLSQGRDHGFESRWGHCGCLYFWGRNSLEAVLFHIIAVQRLFGLILEQNGPARPLASDGGAEFMHCLGRFIRTVNPVAIVYFRVSRHAVDLSDAA